MEELELAAEATPPIVRAVAPGINAAFGTLLRSGADRKNLEADRATVDGMLQAGLTDFRYRGLAMEFETFADAREEEFQRLVTNTVNAARKADSMVDWSKVNLDQFSPEFRRRWILEASNVSDETLQGLWARLLAGELESPGSVSNDTMSIARDMNKERAGEFQILCSAALCSVDRTPMIVVGCGDPGANSLQPHGLSYEILMRLAHHRLIVSDMSTRLNFSTDLGQRRVIVRQQESAWALRKSDDSEPNTQIGGVLFTPAGKELFAVVQKIPVPAYTEAMLQTLKKNGWKVTPTDIVEIY